MARAGFVMGTESLQGWMLKKSHHKKQILELEEKGGYEMAREERRIGEVK